MARRDAYRRIGELICGSRKAFRSLAQEERLDVLDAAKRLYDSGVDYSTAARAEMTTREGFVYVISHPSWPEYVKIGRAFNPESRLRGYQTGCPLREYQMHYAVYFTDCYEAEKAIHEHLAHLQMEGEWFALSVANAMYSIDVIKEII